MKKLLLSVTLGATALLAVPNLPACKGCHGANWEKVALGKSLVVKDMSREDIINSLKGYQDGTYGGPMKGVMLGQVKNLSDADISAIADDVLK